MRGTILVAAIVLGLLGSVSSGTAQLKSEKKGTQWEGTIFCSSNQGKGKFSLTLHEDSTLRSEWTVNCGGEIEMSHRMRGKYKLVDSDFSFVATGTAASDEGDSSRYSLNVTGKLLQTTGRGTYQISYENDEWPPEDNGTWEAVKVE